MNLEYVLKISKLLLYLCVYSICINVMEIQRIKPSYISYGLPNFSNNKLKCMPFRFISMNSKFIVLNYLKKTPVFWIYIDYENKIIIY